MSALDGSFRLEKSACGRWVFIAADGTCAEDVAVVRAFPISASGEGIGIVNREGREVAWIPKLADLPVDVRQAVEEALAGREFMPEIRRVIDISGYAVPCVWRVETDRGETSFTLKAEDDIRRMASPSLMIVDKHGIQFLIRDPRALDTYSRRVLERFV